MKRDSQTQAREILTVGNKVLRQALDIRAEQLTDSVRLLAADFAFRRAVATAEQETIESVLANHGSRINASLTLLLSPTGALLASSDTAIDRPMRTIAKLLTSTAMAGLFTMQPAGAPAAASRSPWGPISMSPGRKPWRVRV